MNLQYSIDQSLLSNAGSHIEKWRYLCLVWFGLIWMRIKWNTDPRETGYKGNEVKQAISVRFSVYAN